MSAERMEILKMVAEKVITVEEGERLLRALGDGEQRRREPEGQGPFRRPGLVGAMEGFGEALAGIGPMVRGVVEEAMAGVGLDLGEEEDEYDAGEVLGRTFPVGPDTELVVRDDPRIGCGVDLELLGTTSTQCEVLDEGSTGARITRRGSRVIIRTSKDHLRVRIPNTVGRVQAVTLGGDITVRGLAAPLTLRSAGGNLELEGICKALKAKTAGGNIRLDLTDEWTGDSRIATMGGTITVRVPARIRAQILAGTMGGQVKVEEGLGQIRRQQKLAKEKVEVNLGDGGSSLEIKTVGGDINLRRLHG